MSVRSAVIAFLCVVFLIVCPAASYAAYLPTTGPNIGIGTSTPVGGLVIMNGNVGIGTWSPREQLEMTGGRILLGSVVAPGTTTNKLYSVAGNLFWNGIQLDTGAAASGWLDAGVIIYQADTTDVVGIGTTTPSTTLEIVKQGALSPLMISSIGTGDGDFFKIDPSGNIGIGTITPVGALTVMNGNVGIGTWSPNAKLVVDSGNILLSSTNYIGYSAGINLQFSSSDSLWQSIGSLNVNIDNNNNETTHTFAVKRDLGVEIFRIQESGDVGIGTTTPVGGTAIMNGNVGIGTWSPSSGLELKGSNASIISTGGTNTNATGVGELYVQGDLEVDGTIYGDGSGLTGTSGLTMAGGWTDGGTNVYTSTTTDNVGIGTTTPDATFSVVSTVAQDLVRVNDGGVGDTTPFVIDLNGNVGVGTSAPDAKLVVEGNDARIKSGFGLRFNEATNNASSRIADIASSGGSILSFESPTLTTRMVVNGGTGRVGIGTMYPGSALAVSGGQTIGSGYTATAAPSDGLLVQGSVGIGTTLFPTTTGLTVMNGTVGIGTWSPEGGLHVKSLGSMLMLQRADGTASYSFQMPNNVPGDTRDLSIIANQTNSGMLFRTSNASGNLQDALVLNRDGNVGIGTSETRTAGMSIMNGNVGIGTWSPSSGLELKGSNASIISTGGTNTNATGAGELYVQGDLEVDGSIYGDGSNITGAIQNGGGWFDGGTNVILATTTDNVGIGTTTPGSSLEIVRQGTDELLKLSSSVTGAGDFLNVSSDGLVGIGTTLNSASTGLSVMNGNVGIGTWSPNGKMIVLGGNVGISNASPNAIMHVGPGTDASANATVTMLVTANGSSNVAVRNSTDNIEGEYYAGSTNVSVGALTSHPFQLITNNTPRVYITAAGGVGIGTTTSVGALSVMSGNVGIGTWSPSSQFEVKGGNASVISTGGTNTNATGAGELYVQGDLEVDGTIYGDGSGLTGTSQLTVAGGWTDGGTNVYTSTTTDNVGIGTTTPSTTLEIVKQGSNAPLMISGAAAGNGDYLLVDSRGGVGIGTTSTTSITGLSVMNGNVGIGTYNGDEALVNLVGTGDNFLYMTRDGGKIRWEAEVYSDTAGDEAQFIFGHSRGTKAVPATTQAEDELGSLQFAGNDSGTNTLDAGASIFGMADAEWGTAGDTSDVPGRIEFRTVPDGTSALTVRMVIKNTGNIGIGTIAPGSLLSVSGGAVVGSNGAYTTAAAPADGLLIQGSVGVGTITPVAGLAIMNGNVGIGTWSPSSGLELKGSNASIISTGGTNTNATGSGELYVQGDLEVDGSIYGDGSNITGAIQNGGGWFDGGTNVILATTTDNVGIGTTTPTATLLVENVGTVDSLRVNDAPLDPTPFVVDANGNVGIGTTTAAGKLILPSGNVGIGTLDPVAGLAVMTGNVGIGTWSPERQFVLRGPYGASAGQFLLKATSGDAFIEIDSANAAEQAGIGLYQTSLRWEMYLPANSTDLRFWDGVDRVTFKNGGNVGIGTINPVGGLIAMNGNVGIGTWSPTYRLQVIGNTGVTGDVYLPSGNALRWGGGAASIYGSGNGNSTDNIQFYTLSGERMRIDADGNVGIGTITPVGALTVMNGNVGIGTWSPTERLQVIGTVNATAFVGDGSGLTNVSNTSGWTDGGTNIYTTLTTDNVGIGTTTPNAATLELVQNAAQPVLKISSTATSGGDYLTVSSTGNVGIGTTTMAENFVVGGRSRLGSGIHTSSVNTAVLVGRANGATDSIIGFNSQTYAWSMGIDNNEAAFKIANVVAADPLGTNPVLTIFNSGNMGIGTTTPVAGLAVMNGNVGIGTWSPTAKLQVDGTVNFNSNGGNTQTFVTRSGLTNESLGIDVNDSNAVFTSIQDENAGDAGGFEFRLDDDGSANPAFSITSDGGAFPHRFDLFEDGTLGIGTTTPVGGTAIMNGNVGIGTWSPRVLAEMSTTGGTLNNVGAGDVYIQNDLEVDGTIYGDAGGLTNIPGVVPSGWTDGGTNVFSTTTTDNVGIGTTTPTATLLIENVSAIDSFRVNDSLLDASPFVINADGNVGIGTTSPDRLLKVGPGSDAGSNGVITALFTNNGTTSLSIRDSSSDVESEYWVQDSFVSIGPISATPLRFITSDVMRMTILSGGNVGIGTSGPGSLLSVAGGMSVGSSAAYTAAAAPADGLMVQGNAGIGTVTPVGGLTVMKGNVGIGTWSPRAGLEIGGAGTIDNATANIDAYVLGKVEADGGFFGDGSGLTNVANSSGWLDGGTNVYTQTTTDNVGIGTTTPTSTLEVVKTAAGTAPLMVSSVATADGDLFVVFSSGNVGIGTFSPEAKLTVVTTGQGLFKLYDIGNDAYLTIGDQVKSSAGEQTLIFRNTDSGANGWFTGIGDDEKYYLTYGGIAAAPELSEATSFFSISSASGNVGIGPFTAAVHPASKLTVVGNAAIGSGAAYTTIPAPADGMIVQGNVGIGTHAPTQGALILSSGNVGIGTINPVNGTAIMNGNVGIGTWSPRVLAEMSTTGGTLNNVGAGDVYIQNDLEVDGTIYGDAGGLTNIPGVVPSGWTDGGTNVYTTLTTDNVGIGTTTPTSTLEVVKTAAGTAPLMVSATAAGDGDFLIVGSAGSVGIGTTLASPVTGLSVMNGNVGIGTWNPGAALHVKTASATATVQSVGGDGYINVDAPAANEAGFGIYSSGTLLWEMLRDNSSTTLSFWNNTADFLLNLTPGGRVGVGTTVPAATFAVNGGSYFAGNVGIGTFYPNAGGILDVRGDEVRIWTSGGSVDNATAAGELYVEGDLEVDGTLYAASASIASAAGWTDGGTNVYTALTTDNVGIGTTTPVSVLTIQSTSAQDILRVNDNGPGDTTPVIIDLAGNVGIGTTTAVSHLDVNGSINLGLNSGGATYGVTFQAGRTDQGLFQTNAGNALFINALEEFRVNIDSNNNGAAGNTFTIGNAGTTVSNGTEVFRVQGNGNVGIGTSASVAGLAVMTGNVGIGTWSPSSGLEVKGSNTSIISTGGTNTNATGSGELYVQVDLEVDGTIYGDGSGVTNIGSVVGAAGWVDPGAIVYQSTTTDFVGIGTVTPSTTFEIVQQSTNPALMISSVFNGDGNLMIVHSGGNVGIGTTQPIAKTVIENTVAIDSFRVNDITADPSPFIIDQSGNVGVGTSTAGSRFVIRGDGTDNQNLLDVRDSANANVVQLTSDAAAQGSVLLIKDARFPLSSNIRLATSSGYSYIYGTNVGIGTYYAGSQLTVAGGAAIGSGQAYVELAAPTNGLKVEGNVGIGTFVPGGSLEVITAANTIPFLISSTSTLNGDVLVVTSAGNVGVGTTGPNAKFVVQGGNVGIGTTNPVNGTAVMNGNVGIGTWSPVSSFQFKASNTSSVVMDAGGNVGIGTIVPVAGTSIMNGNVGIGTWSPTGRLVVLGGNVGIGTTNLVATLDVAATGSLRIPYGYDPTVTASGTVGIGTVNHQFYYNSRGTKRVVPASHTRCLTIENLSSADDDFPMGSFTDAVTINGVWCTCAGTCTTAATFTLEDGSGNAMTITGTNPTCQDIGTVPTAAAVTAANTLTAKESLRFNVTNTPDPDYTDTYEVCVDYTVNAVP